MSSLSDPVGFELDDVLTRVIPGSVFVFSVFIVVVELQLFPEYASSYSTILIAIGIILSFVFGELIELYRYQMFRTPKTFNRLVFRSSKNIEHLYLIDRCRLRLFNRLSKQNVPESGDFESGQLNRLAYAPWMDSSRYYIVKDYDGDLMAELADSNPLPGDDYQPENLYYHLVKQTESYLSKDAKRRQILAKFYTNLKIGLIPTVIFFIYLGYLRLGIGVVPYLILVGFLGSIFVFYGLMVIDWIIRSTEQLHIADLLREYTYQVLISKEVG